MVSERQIVHQAESDILRLLNRIATKQYVHVNANDSAGASPTVASFDGS
jgi:hypothetical protein